MTANLGNLIGDGLLLVLQLVTLGAMTRIGRGWGLTVLALVGYAGLHALWAWAALAFGISATTAIQFDFLVQVVLLTVLVVVLSRDSVGRQLFVAFDYHAYSVAVVPVCQVLALRYPGRIGCLASGIVLVLAHAVFIWVLLPRVPRMEGPFSWRKPCVAAALLFLMLYVTGVWPHSLAEGGWREWTAFAVASVVAWVSLPMMYAAIASQLNNLNVSRNFELMTSEVAVRRAVIDAARRQRHDQRHHRIVLAEYLLRGQSDKALAYLEQLDEEAGETPTDKLVWCENDTINAILSGAARKASAKGVAFEVTAKVGPEIVVADIDTVAVVSNLVENAINATGSGGTVTVALRQRERTVGMTVTNPVPADFALSREGLPSAKPGVGIESVRRVVARYDGELVYTVRDGALSCQAMLRIAEGGKR